MGTTASSSSCRKAVREKTLPLRNKKPLFWMSLIGYSLEYIQYLGLINPDIENLCEEEALRNKKGKFGFVSIIVDGERFVFIPGSDTAINYGYPETEQKNWNYHFLIMAYCVTNNKLNIGNGNPQPWSHAVRRILKLLEKNPDDCDLEIYPWANIVPEEWHQKIINQLKDEIKSEEKDLLKNLLLRSEKEANALLEILKTAEK